MPRRGEHVDDSDVAPLSPLIDEHINLHGHYTFASTAGGDLRPLRDPHNSVDE